MAAARGSGRTSQGRKRGGTSKGRQRIPIALIQDKAKLLVTFSKRRPVLLKMASEMALAFGARVAVVVFSPAGRTFAVGSPSVDSVLRRYAAAAPPACGGGDDDDGAIGGGPGLPGDDREDREAAQATARRAKEARARVKEEKARMDAIEEKVLRAVPPGRDRFWWEADAGALGAEQLQVLAGKLQLLRDNVRRSVDKMQLLSSAPLPAPAPMQC